MYTNSNLSDLFRPSQYWCMCCDILFQKIDELYCKACGNDEKVLFSCHSVDYDTEMDEYMSTRDYGEGD